MSGQTPAGGNNFDFHGDVNAGNINTGTQNIGRDQNIITQTPKAERQCPTPPNKPKEFGGRDGEFNQLKDKLNAGETTAVHGLGGIGKTTLAQMLAHELYTDKTFRAVLWAKMTRDPKADQIIRSWVTNYADSAFSGVSFSDMATLASTAKQHLEAVINEKCEECDPPRVLIVLDDVWDNSLEAARQLQDACPFLGTYATILITTRSQKVANRLNAKSLIKLTHMKNKESVKLLKEYLDGLPTKGLERLGKALGGHPLAMRLAAERIKDEADDSSLKQALVDCTIAYEKGIPAGSPFADLELAEGETREENLEIALSLSYEELSDDEKRRFRTLGILAFDEPFDFHILGAIWEAESDAVKKYTQHLRLLSLIEATGKTGWYRQHPLLRAYARALLNETNEAAPAFDRYAAHLTELAKQFWSLPPEEWGQLEPYFPHLHAMGDELAARWESEPPTEKLAVQVGIFATNLTNYLAHRPEVIASRPMETRMAWLEMGLVVSQSQKVQIGEAFFLNQLGLAWSTLGEKHQALDYYEQALPLLIAVGDRGGEAATLNNIGLVWQTLGEARKALDYYEQALPLLMAVGDRGGEAATLNNIGGAWNTLKEPGQALDYYEQALPAFRAVGDRGGEAATLNNIGLVWRTLGEARKALDYYEKALPLVRAVGDRRGEATTLNNIGLAWSALGDKHQALDFYQQALPLDRAVGDLGSEATTLNNMSYIYKEFGELGKAIACAEKCTELLELIEDVNAGASRNNLARLRAQRDGTATPNDEQAMLQQLIALYQQLGAEAFTALLKQQNLSDEQIALFIALISQSNTEK